MMKVRPQQLLRGLNRALAMGLVLLFCLLLGQAMQAAQWVFLPASVFELRAQDWPAAGLLTKVWGLLWPLLIEWLSILDALFGLPSGSADWMIEGVPAWVVLLPIGLVAFLLALWELFSLRPKCLELSVPEPMKVEPEPARETSDSQPAPIFDALDVVDDQLQSMQGELETLRVALINASLPEPLDDPAEPLEQARLSCERLRDAVRSLRAQQQVIQARAMGFRA
jgi:hypothetical protein